MWLKKITNLINKVCISTLKDVYFQLFFYMDTMTSQYEIFKLNTWTLCQSMLYNHRKLSCRNRTHIFTCAVWSNYLLLLFQYYVIELCLGLLFVRFKMKEYTSSVYIRFNVHLSMEAPHVTYMVVEGWTKSDKLTRCCHKVTYKLKLQWQYYLILNNKTHT